MLEIYVKHDTRKKKLVLQPRSWNETIETKLFQCLFKWTKFHRERICFNNGLGSGNFGYT